MQSGEVRINEEGAISGAICNCCADCCYPHILAEHSNAQKLWPLSRYIVHYLKDRCIACGRCVKRCPFQAFTSKKSLQESKTRPRTIHFNEDLCRGCGVCSIGGRRVNPRSRGYVYQVGGRGAIHYAAIFRPRFVHL